MKRNGLGRLYGKLTAAERFRLDVLATARGDRPESERLVSSCPRATYTTNERGFTGRWTGAENITLRIPPSRSCRSSGACAWWTPSGAWPPTRTP